MLVIKKIATSTQLFKADAEKLATLLLEKLATPFSPCSVPSQIFQEFYTGYALQTKHVGTLPSLRILLL